MDDFERTKNLLEHLNVGVIKYLEKKPGVEKVILETRAPADRHNVLMWEQRNTIFLPEDLKNFLLTSDGFDLSWSVKMENSSHPLGKMHINRVSQLAKIGGNQPSSHVNPSLADLEGDSDIEDEVTGLEKPVFDSRCKIYELDPCDGYGKVCLVYKENKSEGNEFETDYDSDGGNEPKTEIWFLDRSLRWHFLAESFLAYYRIMLMHLGLPQWQYSLTDIGLSPQAQQWFNMYAPVRLELDKEICESGDSGPQPQHVILDINKVFKGGKQDKRKPAAAQQQQLGNSNKKKPLIASAKMQPPNSSRVTASSSQISNKGNK